MKTDFSKLTQQFEAHEIDPSAFRHIDHIGVAYEMFQTHGFLPTLTKFSDAIEAIATKAGAPEKFNVTITLAFLSLIAERIHSTVHSNFDEFIVRNEDLLSKSVLKKMYPAERLDSDLARKVFLLPLCSNLYGHESVFETNLRRRGEGVANNTFPLVSKLEPSSETLKDLIRPLQRGSGGCNE